jgi:hypothetical protein
MLRSYNKRAGLANRRYIQKGKFRFILKMSYIRSIESINSMFGLNDYGLLVKIVLYHETYLNNVYLNKK